MVRHKRVHLIAQIAAILAIALLAGCPNPTASESSGGTTGGTPDGTGTTTISGTVTTAMDGQTGEFVAVDLTGQTIELLDAFSGRVIARGTSGSTSFSFDLSTPEPTDLIQVDPAPGITVSDPNAKIAQVTVMTRDDATGNQSGVIAYGVITASDTGSTSIQRGWFYADRPVSINGTSSQVYDESVPSVEMVVTWDDVSLHAGWQALRVDTTVGTGNTTDMLMTSTTVPEPMPAGSQWIVTGGM